MVGPRTGKFGVVTHMGGVFMRSATPLHLAYVGVPKILGTLRPRLLGTGAWLCLSVCPSVRRSVTFVYCIQTADDIVKLLSGRGNTYGEGRVLWRSATPLHLLLSSTSVTTLNFGALGKTVWV